MDVFMKGEDAALRRYGDPQGDLDFGDVFGGPPRRFFMAAVEEEKPVFGGKSAARRRRHHPGDRFFDDIFRGDESSWRTRRDRDNLFGTTSKAQPFSSLLARSSVGATFGEVEYKMMDGSSSSPYSSRYSNEAVGEKDELRHEVHQVFPQTSFSDEPALSCGDSIYTAISHTPKLEKDGRSISSRYNFIANVAKIFKEGGDSRPKTDVKKQSQSCRWTEQKENDRVDENYRSNQVYTSNKTAYSSESLRWDSKILGEESNDPFEDYFVLQELPDDLEQAATPCSEASEDIKALDAKIGQWSAGKKGNIRSLLSTLQYVLWPGSEWKAIALVDLVEANPVKRAYQRALLHLHPDKLQQKGAASNHKYIAEKVFGILQEAWDHFNNVALVEPL